MSFLKITKYSDVNEIAYISIFGNKIDFRDWYTIKKDNSWSDCWYTKGEINDILNEYKDTQYKKLSKFKTMINLHYKSKSLIKILFFISLGFTIGLVTRR